MVGTGALLVGFVAWALVTPPPVSRWEAAAALAVIVGLGGVGDVLTFVWHWWRDQQGAGLPAAVVAELVA